MNIFKNTFLVLMFGLVLSGCATTAQKAQKANGNNGPQLSSKIIYAPAIDVPYAEVTADIKQNIGTDVRWGGQVIESEVVDESTVRLTVFAYPLSEEGRPIKSANVKNTGGRFIVDLTDGFAQEIDFRGHFVTFYGGVASSLTVSNGNRKKDIPIITAEELVDWNMVDESRNYVDDRRGNSYYSLGYRKGHFGYARYPYYGGFRGRFSSFGFGHFSRGSYYGGRSFGRIGFGRSGFGRGGFGRGFRRH